MAAQRSPWLEAAVKLIVDGSGTEMSLEELLLSVGPLIPAGMAWRCHERNISIQMRNRRTRGAEPVGRRPLNEEDAIRLGRAMILRTTLAMHAYRPSALIVKTGPSTYRAKVKAE